MTNERFHSEDEVLVERQERVLIVTLNRPSVLNAINGAMAQGIGAAISRLDEDSDLSVGILTGVGRGFCSGMDLKGFGRGENIDHLTSFLANGSKKPLIAAIEGFALGGGLELALTCDLLVAASGARLGIPEISFGLLAAGGGLLRLPIRVGYSKAMEMALTGDPISAEEGLQLGLVSRLAAKGEAIEVALQLAERITRNAPLAIAVSKQVIRSVPGRPESELWSLQRHAQRPVFTSNDAKEGAKAFAEKRSPLWTGT